MIIDDILMRFGLKHEDLSDAEQVTLNGWLEKLSTSTLTINDVRNYIASMKYAIELEICDLNPKKEEKRVLRLQARLKNYLLLDAFLATPERAKAMLERSLAGIVPKK